MWVLLGVALIIIFMVYNSGFLGDSQGCNIEDDDIRGEAWMSRVERKQREREEMKTDLTEFMETKWNELTTE